MHQYFNADKLFPGQNPTKSNPVNSSQALYSLIDSNDS